LTTLVATNIFGRNTQAIAANEAQYAEMWAQDSAAMYGYAASSASATSLTPFTPPQQNTNPGGAAGQAAATSQATGTAAGNVQSTIQQAFSSVPNALTSAATSAATSAQASDPLGTLSDLISIFLDAPSSIATFAADIPFGVIGVVALPLDIIGAGTGLHTDDIVSGWNGEQAWPDVGSAPVESFPASLLNLPPGTMPPPSLAAGMGEANTIGALSVPPTWTVATPAVKPISYTLPALPETTVSAAAAPAAEAGSGSMLSEMALAGMAGRAMAGTVGTGASRGPGKAAKGASAPARGKDAATTGDRAATGDKDEAPKDKPRAVVTGVAAELREFAKLRDEGILTNEEYTEQKNRLLGR
jgi:PPE-repeat protein